MNIGQNSLLYLFHSAKSKRELKFDLKERIEFLKERAYKTMTENTFKSQWSNPGDILSLLLLIGGDIVQKAIAQLV